MRRWIVNGGKLTRLFVIEQIREPVALFWSLIAPPLFFVFLNLDALNAQTVSSAWYDLQVSWYLSYIALSSSLFGFSIYLIGRRESGFIRSFIQGRNAKILFLLSQIGASFILTLSYFTIFIMITTTVFGVNTIVAIASLILPFIVIMAMFVWGALIIAVLPITYMSASSGISITLMLMLIFSIAGLKTNLPTLYYINLFNPLSIATRFMSGQGVYTNESIVTIICLIALGVIGAIGMRSNPIWSRQ